MYPAELVNEIKNTTESIASAYYRDVLLSIGRDGQFHTSIYDQRGDFNFFRSLLVIFHFRRPIAFISLSLYYTPGLAPRMNVLF